VLVLLIVIFKGLRVYLKEGGRTDKTSAVRVCMPSLPPFLPSVCTHTQAHVLSTFTWPFIHHSHFDHPFLPVVPAEKKDRREKAEDYDHETKA
jgi:hypothetical protein